jgi:cell division septation protein DedD
VAPIPAKGGTPPPIPEGASDVPARSAAEKLPIQLEVRVASFASDEKARSTVTQLRDSGYPASDVSWKDARNQEWHAVEVGPYAAHEAASRTVLELSTKYGFNPVIVASRVH